MPKLLLEQVRALDFRSLESVSIAPSPHVNVVAGANGHGKTSLLEALYFACTSRSFRTTRPVELVRHGAPAASVQARFRTEDAGLIPHDHVASVRDGRVALRIDGDRPRSTAAYAVRSPVVVFHPQELELTRGSAALRRTLLDRVSFFQTPASSDHRTRYGQALKARQRLLRDRDVSGLDAYEELCALHGAALSRARAIATAAVAPAAIASFARIAAPDLVLGIGLRLGGTDDEGEFRARLVASRARDAVMPTALFGPHRDDLDLTLDGRPLRPVASQGQHRAATLALKFAEARVIADATGIDPLLLLDDVSSELDPARTEALFAFLSPLRAQVFVSTTRPELIPASSDQARLEITLNSGRLQS